MFATTTTKMAMATKPVGRQFGTYPLCDANDDDVMTKWITITTPAADVTHLS